jgi:cell division protein FtsW
MALGSGGIFGQGIGNSRAKLMFLPEPQNDYIFAIIGEELGLIGCLFLMLAYFVLIFKIIKIALHAPDTFSRMFSAGMALLISVQAAFNVAVVTNLVPSTGVILPFVSAGGSSLVSLMIGMGVLLNISRHQKDIRAKNL